MRVLVAGAQGQVGHELMRAVPVGFEIIGLGSRELNLADSQQVMKRVAEIAPGAIINAAAYTAVDRAESESAAAYAVNRDGVALLADQAERAGIPLFHISTDYVFAGNGISPYKESDPVAPVGVYGASKLAGEQALFERCSRALVLRTSWVFGAHGQNFVRTMLRLGRERDELAVVADQRGGPTPAAGIAGALWQLVQLYRDKGELQWGCYHFSGGPACSWYEFAEEIFRQALELGLIERSPRLRAIVSSEYPTPARRPLWSVLDCSKLNAEFGIQQPDWRTELRSVLQEWRDET
ncbi:dTDP-4-dehydrorhamnose reductase [Pseudomonas sp. ML96]|uniref:dTDP-4-dehydrorhamnose reductase n=1 Tax=Pseudomonas sp. ML96 TaxID=1523503 RepID=UPI0005BAA4E5|nr:dTDP-4-dehydrorhamnose reductase [Pseudomonas sp. ML96]